MATQGVVLIDYEQLVKTAVRSLTIPLMLWNYFETKIITKHTYEHTDHTF